MPRQTWNDDACICMLHRSSCVQHVCETTILLYLVLLALYKSKTLAPNPPKFSRSFYSRDFLLFSSGSLGVFCLQAFTTEGVPGVFCHTPNSENSRPFRVLCLDLRWSAKPSENPPNIRAMFTGPPPYNVQRSEDKMGGIPSPRLTLSLIHRWKCQHCHGELYKKWGLWVFLGSQSLTQDLRTIWQFPLLSHQD